MGRLDTLLGWLAFLELLIKEPRNFALGQEVIKLFAGVHGVSHEHRCRQVIARYLHVLNLSWVGLRLRVRVKVKVYKLGFRLRFGEKVKVKG